MTLTDALGIVKGNKDAATQYFKQKTSAQLVAAFSPSVKTSLDKTSATKYYGDIANNYNRMPLSFEKIDPGSDVLRRRQGGGRAVRSDREGGGQHPRQSAGADDGHSQEGVRPRVNAGAKPRFALRRRR